MKKAIAHYHKKILTILLLLLAAILAIVLIKQPPWLPNTVFSPTGLNGLSNPSKVVPGEEQNTSPDNPD